MNMYHFTVQFSFILFEVTEVTYAYGKNKNSKNTEVCEINENPSPTPESKVITSNWLERF